MSTHFEYPWTEFLKSKPSFKLFGYGSLINKFSSAQDLTNSEHMEVVQAYGVKRVFNYDTDEVVRARPVYQDPKRGEPYFAALNAEKYDDFQANGVLIEVISDDYENFIKRERGYQLIEIDYSEFGKNEIKGKCYTLCAPDFFNGRKLVNNDLLPNVPYYLLCREGAAAISKEFLDSWLDTTYISDGRTARQWEQEMRLIGTSL